MIITVLMLAVVPAVVLLLRVWFYFRALGSGRVAEVPDIDTDRYRPMLRLLSGEDFQRIRRDRAAHALRRALFREYLRELTGDYAKLLAGVRLMIVGSSVERPDLAKILFVRRISFALAACRLEVYLVLHASGLVNSRIPELEIFGLIDSALLLRRLFPVESAVWGA